MDENQANNENPEEEENEEEDRLIYTPVDYDPNTSEKIICIELENNQQIFIEYKQGWTVQDLISVVLSRKEFQQLQQNRNMILTSSNHSKIFDFSLCFYDGIVPDHENRLADYISLEKLRELHIIKNYRTPFFVLKQNFMPDSYIYSNNYKLDQLKEIKDSKFNHYAMYLDYMPKMIKWNTNLLLAHPELEDYFFRNKRGYNEFNPFKRNVLTCDKKTIDWFIYDKESIKFLLEMEKKEFVENSNLKYINGKIYFEDKFEKEINNTNNKNADKNRKFSFTKKLTDNELSTFLVGLKIDLSDDKSKKNIQIHKFKITATTTAFDLIKKLGNKLSLSTKQVDFEPKKKILKVLSLNDYIFDVNEPLINFQYINDCVKLNKIAEYLVLDNPALLETNNTQNSSANKNNNMNNNIDPNISSGDINLSSLGSYQKGKQGAKYDLRNIAVYNPILNNYAGEIMDPSTVLEKEVNNLSNNNINANTNNSTYNPRIRKNNIYTGTRRNKQNINTNDTEQNNLDNFINLLNLELEKEIEDQLTNGDILSNKKAEYKIEEIQKNNEEQQTYRKSQVLKLNDENSQYLKKRKRYKNLAMNKTESNIFIEAMKPNNTEININNNESHEKRNYKYKKASLSNINNKKNILYKIRKPLINKKEILITEIKRPFSIMLRGADIIPLLNSTEYDSKTVTTVLLFKFELFSSNLSICPPKQVRWRTTTKVQNPVFNKRIYFDINYSQLPVMTSLIIKIKFIQYNKNKEVFKNDTIFWSNYRLFDPNNKLKVGLHKINLHDREVSDDIYYSFNDNPDEKTSSKIYLEIENFSKPVINKINKEEKKNKNLELDFYPIEQDFLMKVQKII